MAWYNTSWLYRKKITVDYTKLTADVSNFPVYISLDGLGSNFWSAVKNGGGDIRITKSDGTTELAREVVSCNTATSKGELHFKADSISSSTNTDFYIYYGNSGASDYGVTDTYGRNAVWSNGYISVYHLNETTVTSGSTITDSKGANNGTVVNTGLSSSSSGQLGNCIAFSDTAYIRLANESAFDVTTAFSHSTWSKGGGAWQNMGGKHGEALGGWVLRTNGSSYANIKAGVDVPGTSNITGGSWYHVTGNEDGTNLKIYVNGAEQNSVANASTITNNDYACIGNVERSGVADANWLGSLDEVRFSNVSRTPGWITAEYNNTNSPSTFYTIGTQEQGAIARCQLIFL